MINDLLQVIEGVLNAFPNETPRPLVDLVIEKMWNKDPNKRTEMEKIVEWLEQFSGLATEQKNFKGSTREVNLLNVN
ncbi:hypothetical protein OESDEN_02115 [Oesophagostomum dentatum]|uniref:Serine-threonine/tyrosine-protein kinase catalytic domain-containing protein n=1 Tax=Oesophagostomum dentatum TaxID=61180 RepID=A0A0B1TP60_OESDE|nr:hypothetical protein OESDEN_02115 [Oesophagostomum dentatum]